MSDYTAPSGSRFNGWNGQNETVFVLTGHSQQVPRLLKFKRKPEASGNGRTNYSVRAVIGAPLVDGKSPGNSFIDLTLTHLSGQDNAVIKSVLGVIGAMAANVDFQDDAVVELMLPVAAAA